jgi:ribonucleoside-diphosphate reductase alpha chain
VTAIKPEGSGTLAAGVLGNGIHAIHSPYFVRNVRIKKHDPVYRFLKERMPQFVADEFGREELSAVVSIPIKAPGGGIFRTESVLDLLERIKKFNIEWIKAGHRRDSNSNNVSATVYIKGDSEWAEVFEWVWDNRFHYNGMTFLPDYGDGGGYKQAPFIDMTKEEYEDMVKEFPENIDFREVYGTNHKSFEADAACSGGSCEIKHL